MPVQINQSLSAFRRVIKTLHPLPQSIPRAASARQELAKSTLRLVPTYFSVNKAIEGTQRRQSAQSAACSRTHDIAIRQSDSPISPPRDNGKITCRRVPHSPLPSGLCSVSTRRPEAKRFQQESGQVMQVGPHSAVDVWCSTYSGRWSHTRFGTARLSQASGPTQTSD